MGLDVQLKNDTLWLSLNQLAALFIFETNELNPSLVVAFFATTAKDNKTYPVEYFNLDVIIAVGYRVNSKEGTQFRQWATQITYIAL